MSDELLQRHGDVELPLTKSFEHVSFLVSCVGCVPLTSCGAHASPLRSALTRSSTSVIVRPVGVSLDAGVLPVELALGEDAHREDALRQERVRRERLHVAADAVLALFVLLEERVEVELLVELLRAERRAW